MPAARMSLPQSGNLADYALPSVIVELWRRAYTGTLRLTHGTVEKKVAWRQGAPVGCESSRNDDDLARQLLSAGQITKPQLEQLAAHRERHGLAEGAALLALKLIEPKDLVHAMRGQISRRIVDVFGWPQGSFALETDAPREEADAFRVDPLEILHDGLAAFWRPDRIRAALASHFEHHATPSERFEAVLARLRPGPDADTVAEAIDPQHSFGECVGTFLEPARLAAAWILAETGALDFSDGPPGADDEAASASTQINIEIVVRDASETKDAARTEAATGSLELPSAEAEALRKEVLALHERLDELDHYEVLGIERDAPDPEVKKAYFACARRFHPDAVARMGLSVIHREANELFARIAQGYQTLSNPNRRQAYDRRDQEGGTPATDANRVAQAETLFRKGEVLVKVGNFSGALDFLRPCVELWPEEPDYQALLGWALYKNKPSQPETAREHLAKADSLRGDDPLILFRLGMVLRKLGEEEAGQIYLDRSKSLEREAKA